MSSPHITYTPRPDATPEAELNALSAVYSFVLQKGREKQNAAGFDQNPGGDDAMKGPKHDRASPDYTRT